ncbi:hypothetical protein DFP94_108143 [Fontibacillus phaseoli]|uniref:Uncharacterized protein n=1 Tax=Fontibacillus phaseoli TaxID=1416533 RepID=A0A369B8C8_9BACL|nr:hypothetical protein [Fontibacillus phaseoli]RCX17782.1 hypothetical protein DFP94_108143 [Fontibacillus phaseoli]
MMTGFASFIIVLLFILMVLASGRFFYGRELKSRARKLSRTFHLEIPNMDYSFEQIVYFISLPTNIPSIRNASRDNLVIKLDYKSLIFPRLSGLKMYIKSEKEKILLAYLPIKDFRLPALDQILKQGKINESDYRNMSTCKLIHPATLKEINEEVYQQIQVGRKRRKPAGAADPEQRTVKAL